MSTENMSRLKSVLFRMKTLMDEYEFRQIDHEAGPLLDEAEEVLEELPAKKDSRGFSVQNLRLAG